jgi:transcriptional regulator with XRE-family HTH domain
MNTREQLNTLLKSHSMREIGRAAGLTHHTVSKFLSGKSVTLESFKKIELAVTNLTQLDAEKAACSAVRTHSAQVNDLIIRLADADLERVGLAERCKTQAESLGAYQLLVAQQRRDLNVYQVACEAAENACIYHEQKTMDAHHDHALTMDMAARLCKALLHNHACHKLTLEQLDKLVGEYEATNIERLQLKAELQNIYGDHMFMQGLRIGLRYTAVFLVLLLIVAAVCWFGGV